jgi:transposase
MTSRDFAVVAARRIWSSTEKQRIVAEAYVSGANISAVAHNNGVAQSLLYRWRKDAAAAGRATSKVFVPVALTTAQSPVPQAAAKDVRPKSSPVSSRPAFSPSLIEVVLEGGRTLRVAPDIDAGALARILAILKANPSFGESAVIS